MKQQNHKTKELDKELELMIISNQETRNTGMILLVILVLILITVAIL